MLNGEAGLSAQGRRARGRELLLLDSAPAGERPADRATDRSRDVQGLAWVDHEWGSGGLGAGEAGWDWFALQLADGSALMFYALRDRGGGRDPHSAGTWIAA